MALDTVDDVEEESVDEGVDEEEREEEESVVATDEADDATLLAVPVVLLVLLVLVFDEETASVLPTMATGSRVRIPVEVFFLSQCGGGFDQKCLRVAKEATQFNCAIFLTWKLEETSSTSVCARSKMRNERGEMKHEGVANTHSQAMGFYNTSRAMELPPASDAF